MFLGSTHPLTEMITSQDGSCIQLTNLPPSCADCHYIWELQPPRIIRACPDLYRNCFTFNIFSQQILKQNSLISNPKPPSEQINL